MRYSMEKVSIKIADILLKKHYIEESMYNVYQYGMQMALEIGFSFITSIVICCLWGKIVEGIIFFAVFIPLRSFLGGFHMKGYMACYICSCVTLIIVLGLSSLAPDYFVSWPILVISIAVIFFEAKKECVQSEDGKHFYPIICLFILVILIMSAVLTALGSFSLLFLLACTNGLVAASKLLERIQEISMVK